MVIHLVIKRADRSQSLIKRSRIQTARKSQVMQVAVIIVEHDNNCPQQLMRHQALQEDNQNFQTCFIPTNDTDA